MKHNVFWIIGIVAVGSACYLFGLVQGTNRAVKGSNSRSILFFLGIHRSLKAGDIPAAIKLTENGIATHAGVIQTAEDAPQSALVFLFPWMGDPLTDTYKKILGGAHDYLTPYPEAVSPDTKGFLARYQADYQSNKTQK